MKKYLSLFILLLLTTFVFAQKNKNAVEVLYFKANLCGCKARVCTAVGMDIQSIIEKSYTDNSIIFSEVKIADVANKEMVTKYNAKSQTLIIIRKKRKKEFFLDVSDLVTKYSRDKNKQAFEDAFKTKITELKKMR